MAIGSVGVGLAALLIAFLIMKGFQDTVKEKIYRFSGHLVITRMSMSNSTEEQPVPFHMDVYDHPEKYPGVERVQEYAHKPALIKTDDEVLGVVLKGVSTRFHEDGFKPYLLEGSFIQFPDSGYAKGVVVSKIIADKLNAKVGDDLVVHFFQNPPRFRRLTISGIYETNLSEYYDARIVLGDIRLIRRLNDWPDSVAGGLEVFLKDDRYVEQARETIGREMDFDQDIERVSDKYINVFEWLQLLSRQVNVLLVIILLVVSVNIISIVLILVMERTQMIGMLKALGASDSRIRSVFIYNGINLTLRGLFTGNALGLGLCYIQDRFKLIPLNPHDYYMSFVPISWHWDIILLLNLLTFVIVGTVLILPTVIITKISPIHAIRFS